MTLHRLAAAIDAGAILDQEAVRMPADVTATRAAILLHQHGRAMLDRLLDTVAATGALPEGRMADVLPYCPFPDRAMLANLKRRGLRLTDAADLAAAARLSLR